MTVAILILFRRKYQNVLDVLTTSLINAIPCLLFSTRVRGVSNKGSETEFFHASITEKIFRDRNFLCEKNTFVFFFSSHFLYSIIKDPPCTSSLRSADEACAKSAHSFRKKLYSFLELYGRLKWAIVDNQLTWRKSEFCFATI